VRPDDFITFEKILTGRNFLFNKFMTN